MTAGRRAVLIRRDDAGARAARTGLEGAIVGAMGATLLGLEA